MEEQSDVFLLKYKRVKLRIRRCDVWMISREWSLWRKYYLPNFPLKGKIVLDIGAGVGETALLFFDYGAEKVITVEPNREAAFNLLCNRHLNDWNIDVYNEPFSLRHLDLPHDYMKMDCEGSEKLLLAVNYDKPCVIEVHDKKTLEGFLAKGFELIKNVHENIYLISNAK